MKLLTQKGPTCLLAAAAMVLECPTEVLVTEIGHDGTAIIWPDAIGDSRIAGIHIQELIPSFLKRGYCLMSIEAMPSITNEDAIFPIYVFPAEDLMERFLNFIKGRKGIIALETHAVAWDGTNIFDPQGRVYPIEESPQAIKSCWLCYTIKS